MNLKGTLTILLTICCALSVGAQVSTPKATQSSPKKVSGKTSPANALPKISTVAPLDTTALSTQLQTAAARAQARRVMTKETLNPRLLTRAEELLQHDKDTHGGHAQHNLMYYYRQLQAQEQSAAYWDEYNPALLYRAEELLQKDREAHGGHAQHSLDYYYHQLLDKENAQ